MPAKLFCSPQVPEGLIFNGDTIAIYSLPSEGMPENYEKAIFKFIDDSDNPIMYGTSNWRGYQGIWTVEDDKLFMTGVLGYDNSIMNHAFGKLAEDGKVFASWFTGTIIIPKGILLRWDHLWDHIYEKELILTFQNGKLISEDIVDNYKSVEGGISRHAKWADEGYYIGSRLQYEILPKFNAVDWSKFDEFDVPDEPYIITIGADGKVISVKCEFADNEEKEESYSEQLKIVNQIVRDLKFDVIYSHGEPYEEKVYLNLSYDSNTHTMSLSDY